jgi:transcriptional regulator with XRE-family HTH domain
VMLPGLRFARLARGLTQDELSDVSGVHRDTIQKLEADQRPARPATIKKLSDALGVEAEELAKTQKEEKTMELSKAAKKVEVEVRWETKGYGTRGEILRFRGEEIDAYEDSGSYFTLYQCPDGYRVHVLHGDGTAYLNPSRQDPHTREIEYPTYTVEKLIKEFPNFGEVVGVYRVRDID